MNLGRGIASLLESRDSFLNATDKITMLEIEKLLPGRFQPRKDFELQALQELSESIKEHGILQPIVVREIAEEKFEIIAGERRFQAARLIELQELPVIIKELSDVQALQLAIIENIQRKDLNIIEESESYQRLIAEFDYTQEALAKILSKNRSHVANILRINKLEPEVKELLKTGQISFGHAKLLVNVENSTEIAQKIVSEGMTVRVAEKLIKELKQKTGTKVKSKKKSKKKELLMSEFDIQQLENTLKNSLQTNVKIEENKIIVEFSDLGKLDFILEKLDR